MNDYEKGLWKKIKEFEFDEPGIAFCFTDRLARENCWSKNFAERATEEYRKFIYLCCVSRNQITPSEEVDQVWHLHLTFTKSYWKEMCGNVLNRELHHHPTKGGKAEEEKFDGCYTQTLQLYHQHFGEEAPRDIWPENEKRFSPSMNIWLDKRKYWLIRKPHLRTRIVLTILLLAVAGGVNVAATAMDWISLTMVVIAIVAIAWIASKGGGKGGSGSCSSGCSVAGCGGSHSSGGCSSGCGGGGCGGGCGS